jgi:4-amino-4-deoxy-L-arabinose transferase-like glycosyltransferase
MQRAAGQHQPANLLYIWGIAFIYFCINAIALFAVSGTADRDQAEQLILSQALQLGYSSKPPLYTYIVKAVFHITGPGLVPLLALKAVLLSLFVGSIMALGKQFRFTTQQHLIALASLVFIPQYIWESQRDLTHSVLVTTIAAATLLQFVRTRRGPTAINYVVLGALTGLGLIGKYNYAMFLTALLLAAMSVPQYRQVLANRRILATLLVALLVATPHIFWLVSNPELATGSVHKLHIDAGSLAAGLPNAAAAALAFLSPLLIFSMLLVSGPAMQELPEKIKVADSRLLLNLLIATLIVVATFVMATGAQQIKDRWYQPLLFYVPLIIAMLAMPAKTRLNWYLGLGFGFALLVSVALVGRTTFAGFFDKYSRPNIPYPEMIASMADRNRKPVFILAETSLLGGNSRPVFPAAVIQVPSYSIDAGPMSGDGLVVCETPDCDDGKFREWLESNYAIDARLLKFTRVEMPYRYAPAQTASIYFSRVSLSP